MDYVIEKWPKLNEKITSMTEAENYDIILKEDNANKFLEEDKRLGGSSPFITTLKLSIGPILFAAIMSFQDAIDLYFIRKGFGPEGVTIVTIAGSLKFLFVALASFHLPASVIKISECITKKLPDETGQLFADILRYCFIIGLIVPPTMYFIVPKLLAAMGMPEILIPKARRYLFPMNVCTFFDSTFNSCCSLMNAEGRASVTALIQAIELVAKILMDPLLIYGFKAPIEAMGLADSIPTIISSVTLITCTLLGKFSTKPKLSYFKTRFSHHFGELLKLCVPNICSMSLGVFCPIFVVSLVTKAATNIGKVTEVSTCYSSSGKVYTMLMIIIMSSLAGLAPSATWAFHKQDLKRMYKLAGCSTIIPLTICFVGCLTMIFFPKKILKIWISGETLDLAPKITPKIFYTFYLEPLSAILNNLLIIFKQKYLAIVPQVLKAVCLLTSAVFLYMMNKTKPENVLYCNAIQDTMNFTISMLCFIYTYKRADSLLSRIVQPDDPMLQDDPIIPNDPLMRE